MARSTNQSGYEQAMGGGPAYDTALLNEVKQKFASGLQSGKYDLQQASQIASSIDNIERSSVPQQFNQNQFKLNMGSGIGGGNINVGQSTARANYGNVSGGSFNTSLLKRAYDNVHPVEKSAGSSLSKGSSKTTKTTATGSNKPTPTNTATAETNENSTAANLAKTLAPMVKNGRTEEELRDFMRKLGYNDEDIGGALSIMGYDGDSMYKPKEKEPEKGNLLDAATGFLKKGAGALYEASGLNKQADLTDGNKRQKEALEKMGLTAYKRDTDELRADLGTKTVQGNKVTTFEKYDDNGDYIGTYQRKYMDDETADKMAEEQKAYEDYLKQANQAEFARQQKRKEMAQERAATMGGKTGSEVVGEAVGAVKKAGTDFSDSVARNNAERQKRVELMDAPISDEEKEAQIKAAGDKAIATLNFERETAAQKGDRWITDRQAEVDGMSDDDRIALHELSAAVEARDNAQEQALDIFGNQDAPQQYDEADAKVRELRDKLSAHGYDVDELLQYQTMMSNADKNAKEMEAAEQLADQSGTGSTLLSVGLNMFGAPVGALDLAGQYAQRKLTGSDAPVDVNTRNQSGSNMANAIRSRVSNNVYDGILEHTGSTSLASLASATYQLGASALDTMAASGLTGASSAVGEVAKNVQGKLATNILGSAAGVQAFKDAKARGVSDDQAALFGSISGLAEGFFEEYSLERIKKFNELGKNETREIRALLLEGAKSMIGEGEEELATEIANSLADYLINDKASNVVQDFNAAYSSFIKQGYTNEEAERLAKKAASNGVIDGLMEAMIGGAVMGAAFVGGGYANGKISRDLQLDQYNRAIAQRGADAHAANLDSQFLDEATRIASAEQTYADTQALDARRNAEAEQRRAAEETERRNATSNATDVGQWAMPGYDENTVRSELLDELPSLDTSFEDEAEFNSTQREAARSGLDTGFETGEEVTAGRQLPNIEDNRTETAPVEERTEAKEITKEQAANYFDFGNPNADSFVYANEVETALENAGITIDGEVENLVGDLMAQGYSPDYIAQEAGKIAQDAETSMPSLGTQDALEESAAERKAEAKEVGELSEEDGGHIRLTENDENDYFNTGTDQHTTHSKERLKANGDYPILITQDDIKEFVDKAIHNERKPATKTYGLAGKKLIDLLRQKTDGNIDISGRYLELNSNDLRHSWLEHGPKPKKKTVPLSDVDYEQMANYLDDADSIIDVFMKKGRLEFKAAKKIDGYTVIVECISNQRNAVMFKNAWGISTEEYERKYATKAKKIEPSVYRISAEPTVDETATAYRNPTTGSINKIAQNSDSVNTDSAIGATHAGSTVGLTKQQAEANAETPSQSNTNREFAADTENYTHQKRTNQEVLHEVALEEQTESDSDIYSRLTTQDAQQWTGEDYVMGTALANRILDEAKANENDTEAYVASMLRYKKLCAKMQEGKSRAGFNLHATQIAPSPQRSVEIATDTVSKAKEKAVKRNKKQYSKVEKRTTEAVKSAEKQADTEASKEFETIVGGSMQLADNFDAVSDRLAESIRRQVEAKEITPQTEQDLAINELVKQLTGVAVSEAGVTKEKASGVKPTAIQQLQLALQNQDAYNEAWQRARQTLKMRYALGDEALARLDGYFNSTLSKGGLYANKTVARAVYEVLKETKVEGKKKDPMVQLAHRSAFGSVKAVEDLVDEVARTVNPPEEYQMQFRQSVRDAILMDARFQKAFAKSDGVVLKAAAKQLGINFSELVTKSDGDKEVAKLALTKAIQEQLRVTYAEAQTMTEAIASKYYATLADAAQKNLRRIFAEKKGTPKVAKDRFLELLRMGVYDQTDIADLAASKFGVAPLTEDQTKRILDLMEEAENLPENSEQRVNLEMKVAAVAAENVGTTFKEKFDAWRYTAMLGNVRTNDKNIGGNVAMGLSTIQKNNVLAALEIVTNTALKAMGKEQIQRTAVFSNPFSAKRREYLGKAFEYASEMDYRRLTGTSEITDIARQMSAFGKVFDNALFEGLRTRSSDALSEADDLGAFGALAGVFGKNSKQYKWIRSKVAQYGGEGFIGIAGLRNNYARAMANYMMANNIPLDVFDSQSAESLNIMQKASDYALKEALEATYHAENKFADEFSQFKKNLQAEDSGIVAQATGSLLEGVLPFVKTPVNVAVEGFRYSPLGFIETMYYARESIKTGKFTANDVLNSLARNLTGTMLSALGYALYSMGALTSGIDDDEKDLAQATGMQAYSIRIPSKDGGYHNYQIDWADNIAMPMLVGAELCRIADTKDGFNLNAMATAAKHITNPLLEMSFLSSLNDLLDNLSYSDSKLSDLAIGSATSYLTQGIPTIGGQIARATTGTRRTTYSDTGIPDLDVTKDGVEGDAAYTVNKIKNKIPGLANTNEEYIDPWGKTQKNGNVLYQMASPGYYSKEKSTPVDTALKELYDDTGVKSVLPKVAEKKLKLDGEERKLQPKEYTEFAKKRGETAYDLMDKLTSSSDYKSMNNDQKVDAVKEMQKLAKNYAAQQQFGSSYSLSDNDQKILDAYRSGGANGAVSAVSDIEKKAAINDMVKGTGSNGSKKKVDYYNSLVRDSKSPVSKQIDDYLTVVEDKTTSEINKDYGATSAKLWLDTRYKADANGNGSITQEEMETYLAGLNASNTDKAILWYYQSPDSDKWNSRNPYK